MIKIEIKISGPRGCGKTFFLNHVEQVINSMWRRKQLTRREDFGEQIPTETLTVEIENPINYRFNPQ